jgi:energy-converting hydrogenase Eha subunit A
MKDARRPQPWSDPAVSKPSVRMNFLQALVAIVLGNVVYFLLVPSLPPIARHRPLRIDLGMAVDFWFCLVAYGLIRTARKWR